MTPIRTATRILIKCKDKLPDTGANEDHDSKGTLLGTLFAGLGALLLGRRRKKIIKKNSAIDSFISYFKPGLYGLV